MRPWPSASAKHGSVVGGAWGSLSGYGLPAFFVSLSCRAKGYNQQGGNRELHKEWSTERTRGSLTTVSGRIERVGIPLANKQLWPNDFALNLSVNHVRGYHGCRISGSPDRRNRKSTKMKVVAEIEFFRTSHARPTDSAWKCPNGLNFVVGGTSDCQNPTTVRPCSSDM